MSRCCICDSCPETDSHAGQDFKWYDQYGGFVCSVCLGAIYESTHNHDSNVHLGTDAVGPGTPNPFAIAESIDDDWDLE